MRNYITLCLIVILIVSCSHPSQNHGKVSKVDSLALKQAKINGDLANEGLQRCQRFVTDWLAKADTTTGLIPRNLDESLDIWNAQDAAADNYPFMVLTAALTDSNLFQGRMLDMLHTETRLTSRLGNLPDTYSFSKKGFETQEYDLHNLLFGSSEYIKDGLLPLTEWLGPSPWSDRMIAILDDIWKYAPIKTSHGNIPSTNVELNGEMLQVLSRVYWMTGEGKYLEWATRLGDYYVFGDHHPTRNFEVLRLRDHGCEIVSGLCELYATLSKANPEKKEVYQPHIHEMLNRILAVGRNDDGLFYNAVDPKTGTVKWEGTTDNFGYTLNGFYTVFQIDSVEAYREATIKALEILNQKYRNYDWEHGSSDGYADAIEGALNLYAREPLPSTEAWVESEIQVMWSLQDSSHRKNAQKWKGSGIIEGWHGDGNFARTTIMYCLWKTQGTTIQPWRSDIKLGAVDSDDGIILSIKADEDWQGILKFDAPRHHTIMQMPADWPRINQFPEWFTVNQEKAYEVKDLTNGSSTNYKRKQLLEGIEFTLKKGTVYAIRVSPI
ncbi:hypothetical protein [Ulvibacterium marinum]|uniref:hypothetical protein n=1 Tax=Ulvibacterium marinum TaxID=2419782 RepID=UPI000EA9E781|nr:hypothetical protein [Ulvibacterium marinum]